MNGRKLGLALLTLGFFAAATVGRELVPARGIAAETMVEAAERFVAAFSPTERSKALLSFEDSDRTRWHYVPVEIHPRKGLPVHEMQPESRLLAHALLHSGLGQSGYLKATTIMSLEAVLHRLEQGGRFDRDPELYYFTVFGEPSSTARWGWRVEGHHLSLNFVIENGRLISATPAFFGANPARIGDGSTREGLTTLPREEELARALLHSLDAAQRRAAIIAPQAPDDINEPTPLPPDLEPSGLAASEMTAEQTEPLWALLEEYASRMPEPVAQQWLAEIRDAGQQRIHFAWAGGDQSGQPHYYRIQGPTFLIEYANTQNGGDGRPANHIHSVWRSRLGDFALNDS